jgi:hypothetical protein
MKTKYEILADIIKQQKETIKTLVGMVDELRSKFNNSERHDIYLDYTERLNKLQEEGQIE